MPTTTTTPFDAHTPVGAHSTAYMAALLAEYDAMRAEFLALERKLDRACINYGTATGRWGFTKHHLRTSLAIMAEKGSDRA